MYCLKFTSCDNKETKQTLHSFFWFPFRNSVISSRTSLNINMKYEWKAGQRTPLHIFFNLPMLQISKYFKVISKSWNTAVSSDNQQSQLTYNGYCTVLDLHTMIDGTRTFGGHTVVSQPNGCRSNIRPRWLTSIAWYLSPHVLSKDKE